MGIQGSKNDNAGGKGTQHRHPESTINCSGARKERHGGKSTAPLKYPTERSESWQVKVRHCGTERPHALAPCQNKENTPKTANKSSARHQWSRRIPTPQQINCPVHHHKKKEFQENSGGSQQIQAHTRSPGNGNTGKGRAGLRQDEVRTGAHPECRVGLGYRRGHRNEHRILPLFGSHGFL